MFYSLVRAIADNFFLPIEKVWGRDVFWPPEEKNCINKCTYKIEGSEQRKHTFAFIVQKGNNIVKSTIKKYQTPIAIDSWGISGYSSPKKIEGYKGEEK